MDISQPAISSTRSSSSTKRSYDGPILLGYALLCIVALAAVYFWWDRPSFSADDIAIALALP